MKKKVKIAILSAIAMCLCGAVGVQMLESASADVAYVADIFGTEKISIKNDYRISGEERQGVALLAKREGSSFVLAEKHGGTFELDFKFCAENPDYALSEAVMTFSDNTNENNSFDLHIVKNPTGINFYVEVEGKNAGIYYENGMSSYQTEEYNAKQTYTKLANGLDMKLSFDPETLKLYVQTDVMNNYLIWDLSQTINDGKDIGVNLVPFGDYKVETQFKEIAMVAGVAASHTGLVLYEYNGQSLNGITLLDNAAPTMHANVNYNAVVNKEYIIPNAYAFDVYDGTMENVTVTVKRGNEVLLEQVWTENTSFIPTSTGNYTLCYQATDSNGKTTTREYVITAYSEEEALSDFAFSINTPFVDSEYGVNSKILLPKVYFDGVLNRAVCALPTVLNVTLNGVILEEWTNVESYGDKVFTFDEVGEYKFSFSDKNGYLPKEYAVSITVTEEKPAFALNTAIKSVYAYGTALPKIDYAFTYGETVLETSAKLIYPDGTEVELNENLLDMAGYYTLVFTTEYNGAIYQQTRTFMTNTQDYTMTGSAAAVYGTVEKYDGIKGLLVTFEEKADTFTFNRVVDLNDFKANQAFLQMYVLPEEQGTADFKDLYITLTDIYDPTNQLSIRFCSNNADVGWVPFYVTGAALHVGQQYSGYYGNTLCINSRVGAMTYVEASKYGTGAVMLGYDMSTNTAYTSATGSGGTTTIIADFDNEVCFEKLWNGFTTGEVYVSLSIDGLTSKTSILIDKMGNYDLSNTSGNVVHEPTLLIDYNGYKKEELPLALLGKEYPLFRYQAKDIVGQDCNVFVSVEHNGKEYPITNMSFIPDSVGTYTITYLARDGFGNETIQTYAVEATADNMPLKLEVYDIEVNGFVGYAHAIGKIFVGGNVGRAEVSIFARNVTEDEEVEITDGYVFEKAGVYALRYQVTDYIGRSAEVVKFIEITAKKELLYERDAEVPFAMLNGGDYVLPEMDAYYWNENGDKVYVNSYITVSDGAGVRRLETLQYTPNEVRDGEITVTYTAEKDGYTSAVSERKVTVIHTYDESTVFFEKYFMTDEYVIAEKTDEAILLTASKDGMARFINPVIADGCTLDFEIPADFDGMSKLHIYLTDSKDSRICIKLTLTKGDATNSHLSLNDSKQSQLVRGSFVNSKESFELMFDNAGIKVYTFTGLKMSVNTTLYGETFSGFPSGRVYTAFEFEGVTKPAAVQLNRINNQYFNVTKDTARAQIFKVGTYGGRTDIGATVTTGIAGVGDVLSANNYISMSVYNPNGEIVTSVDGVRLENVACDVVYRFVCSEYGSYEVIYVGGDGKNKEVRSNYVLNVVDVTPPDISVDWTLNASYALNTKVTLPELGAYDMNGIADSRIVIEFPDGKVYKVSDTTLVLDKVGTYYINYVAYDFNWNMQVLTYTITVA